MPREQLEAWAQKDPLKQCEQVLAHCGLGEEILRLSERVGLELDEATALAEESPLPQGPEVLEGVYAP